ncbi:unnamed protein product [Trichogramma brassicae]|uniref:Integrase catalytic domain-containing protein n=1 Tax=Trichogramma brassicae TaxID=86971 RepID=A0A6H5IVV2_9HYME|nr:unnamed protein product [Trichogramma brassicae]
MGPYPTTSRRKRFILVVTDLFSRWVEAFAMTSSETTKVIQLMENEVFVRWGYPKSILSDNGPQFRSTVWQDACNRWQAALHTTDPLYTQCQSSALLRAARALALELDSKSKEFPHFWDGLDYEDPDRYLTKCQEYVTALQIPDANKVSVLEKGLKGAAEKWWLCYKPMSLSFQRFSELLRTQFDSQSIKSALVSKLYGSSQTEKKSVGTFLQQKYMMYQRLRPNEEEAARIATMIELLRPSVRKGLRPHAINDFATLLTKSQELESDETAERNAATNKSRPKDSEQPKEKKKQLPKCWHCPEYHYNNDCPTKNRPPKQENWRHHCVDGSELA